MENTVLREVVLLFAGFVFSITAALIGAHIQRWHDRRRERRPLNQLLNFGASRLLFVFPHRNEVAEAILPRTSTEDFLAMNNFITGLLNVGSTRQIGVKDVGLLLGDDRRDNLVIICSPKSNKFASEFQEKCWDQLKAGFFFMQDENKYWHIEDFAGGLYYSNSFKQEAEYRAGGCLSNDLPSKKFEDFAIITKLTNPWNTRNKVFWIAGIRGIGTWGAAECVKKEWGQLYNGLSDVNKAGDFSALVKIEYDNCDIRNIQVIRVIELKKAAA